MIFIILYDTSIYFITYIYFSSFQAHCYSQQYADVIHCRGDVSVGDIYAMPRGDEPHTLKSMIWAESDEVVYFARYDAFDACHITHANRFLAAAYALLAAKREYLRRCRRRHIFAFMPFRMRARELIFSAHAAITRFQQHKIFLVSTMLQQADELRQ